MFGQFLPNKNKIATMMRVIRQSRFGNLKMAMDTCMHQRQPTVADWRHWSHAVIERDWGRPHIRLRSANRPHGRILHRSSIRRLILPARTGSRSPSGRGHLHSMQEVVSSHVSASCEQNQLPDLWCRVCMVYSTFFFNERRIILHDNWVYQHVTSTLITK
jgi:hypothetical protein